MEWILSLHWKWFLLRLSGLIILAPVVGYLLIGLIESFEIAWKSNNKKKRWKACALAVIFIALAFGWFR